MNPSDRPNMQLMPLLPRFMIAIRRNDVVKTLPLLEAGVDLDTTFYTGFNMKPALCICIEERSIEVAEMLIRLGCSVNLSTGKRMSPLHLAVANDLHELVKLLIENRANVNARNDMWQTPLHVACSDASYETYLAIANAYATINVFDGDGKTPLIKACSSGKTRIALSLIERGANVKPADHMHKSALNYAVTVEPSLKLVKALIKQGAEVNPDDRIAPVPVLAFLKNLQHTSPLDITEACDILKFLIYSGCKLNARAPGGLTALHIAITGRISKIVKILLNSGCPYAPDNLGKSPLFYACYYNNREIVQLLIAAGICWEGEQWMKRESLRSSCNSDIVAFCVEQSKKFPTLCELSRTVIRSLFAPDLERSVDMLSCPPLLKEYIKLEHY